MPNLDPLQNVIKRLTDMSLPVKQVRKLGKRAASEARTGVRTQYQQLNNIRNTLQQQRTAAMNQLNTQRQQLPQGFNQAIQAAINNSMQDQNQRGAVASSGLQIQNALAGGAQALGQNAADLGNIASQQSQAQQSYLNDLISQVFQPQQQVAAQEGSDAAQRYEKYIDAAKQELYQGRLNNANRLLNKAQQEYQDAVIEMQNRFQKFAQNQQNKVMRAQKNAMRKAASYASVPNFNFGIPKGVKVPKSLKSAISSTSAPSSYKRDLAQAAARAGIPASQIPAFNWVIQHESSFNPRAKNPTSTAYGYGQFLASTRRDYERRMGLNYNNPVDQLIMTYQYMKDRYGSPQGAKAFWQKNHWY
jgi:hypothetical protein